VVESATLAAGDAREKAAGALARHRCGIWGRRGDDIAAYFDLAKEGESVDAELAARD